MCVVQGLTDTVDQREQVVVCLNQQNMEEIGLVCSATRTAGESATILEKQPQW